MPAPAWGLDPKDIENVKEHAFEFLCRQLLDFEMHARHDDARLYGPPRRFKSDEGMDLEFVTRRIPLQPKTHYAGALTDDGIGIYCVNCKTGQDWARA
jgi:hypothetical protein